MATRSSPGSKRPAAPGSKRAAATGGKRPAVPPADPSVRVLRRFRLVFNAVKSHFRDVETRAGISGAQLWALSVVRAHPRMAVGALARAMDIHQSTASNLLRGLVDAGLVTAERGGEDRRAVQLVATARGTRLLAKAPGPFSGVLPEALARLDAATLARLEKDLNKLIAELGADRRGASIPLGTDEP